MYDPILDIPKKQYEGEYHADMDMSDYEEKRDRGRAWDRAMRHAISMGHMAPEDAMARGYRPSGHEYGGGKFGDPEHGWKPLPPELYHVTTNTPGVVQHGLKTRAELGQQRGLGLGAGDDDTISFTHDPAVAQNIYNTMMEAHSVARGEYTPAQMIEHAREGVGAARPFLDDLWRHQGDWKPETGEVPQSAQDLINGVQRHPGGGLATKREDWAAQGYTPDEKSHTWMGGDNEPRYMRPVRQRTPEEQREANFDFYKTFLAYREHAGGSENPLFMSTDVNGLAQTDPRNIGIVSFQPKPGALGYQMGALGEWRTPTGQAVDVKNVLTDSNTAPHLAKLSTALYKRWAFSPTTGNVELSDNSGDPLNVKYHGDMAREINEPDLVHGYAYRLGDGWRLTDWESQPVSDPYVIAQVMRKLRAEQGASASEKGPWEPDYEGDWARVHLGLPG